MARGGEEGQVLVGRLVYHWPSGTYHSHTGFCLSHTKKLLNSRSQFNIILCQVVVLTSCVKCAVVLQRSLLADPPNSVVMYHCEACVVPLLLSFVCFFRE